MRAVPFVQRFDSKWTPEPNTGCWLWFATINADGYGRVSRDGRNQLAHRVSYELRRGTIPEGLCIDHLCRVRRCVNPDHMEVVTKGVNTLRGETIPAAHAARSTCRFGHPLTKPDWSPKRLCHTCRLRWESERRERRRSARAAAVR
jgi:hypothetical protein